MKLHFLTIVLDGMPWIAHHLTVFNRLEADWTWHVVEGTARATHCTSWCRTIPPRLSQDGTTEYLDSLRGHPRVKLYRQEQWDGKIEMVNAPLANIQEPGLLMEIDADEFWTARQIMVLRQVFLGQPQKNCADFYCRYFVGPNLIVKRTPNTWTNHYDREWRRAWRFAPGMRFEKHEPPVMDGQTRLPFTQEETSRQGLVFDHYAYVTRAQLEFKEKYYMYDNALTQWRQLQENTQWPAPLRQYFSWVKDDAVAVKLYE